MFRRFEAVQNNTTLQEDVRVKISDFNMVKKGKLREVFENNIFLCEVIFDRPYP